jgi:hypothetical protein
MTGSFTIGPPQADKTIITPPPAGIQLAVGRARALHLFACRNERNKPGGAFGQPDGGLRAAASA